jgi:hypothetical protein
LHCRAAFDDLSHGFGLREVEDAVEVGALGELAGPRVAGAEADCLSDDLGDDRGAAVAADLCDRFAGVACALGEKGAETVVDLRLAYGDGRVVRVARLFANRWAKRAGDGVRIAPGEADYGYRSSAGRGGWRNYCVFEVCDDGEFTGLAFSRRSSHLVFYIPSLFSGFTWGRFWMNPAAWAAVHLRRAEAVVFA